MYSIRSWQTVTQVLNGKTGQTSLTRTLQYRYGPGRLARVDTLSDIDGRLIMTIREPLERFMSFVRHLKRGFNAETQAILRDQGFDSDMSEAEIIDSLLKRGFRRDNGHYRRQYYAVRERPDIHLVPLENAKEAVEQFLGVELPFYLHENRSLNLLSDISDRRVMEHYRIDYDTFGEYYDGLP